ncbi:Panacea domain-containing protein [Paraclostridium sordellii]|uniref:Panacea domain-containing protein n=1 Tax=Paraclostridium sordellii TaxID=1505 RepID=UPI000C78CFDE|nr:type II toxin-antitoxin system antitoxin SocA domain-containing protein [Paeniclostridium sordellii]
MGKVTYLFNNKGEKEMFSVFDIANYFLSKEPMTNKKLQKLCYYAQAWYLALHKEPLINSSFEAWVHGPVSRDLYSKYKNFRANLIPLNIKNIPGLNEDIIDHLETVFNTYGGFNGDELEILTHSEDPWIKARLGYEEWEPCNVEIDPELMKKYYWSIYAPEEN